MPLANTETVDRSTTELVKLLCEEKGISEIYRVDFDTLREALDTVHYARIHLVKYDEDITCRGALQRYAKGGIPVVRPIIINGELNTEDIEFRQDEHFDEIYGILNYTVEDFNEPEYVGKRLIPAKGGWYETADTYKYKGKLYAKY